MSKQNGNGNGRKRRKIPATVEEALLRGFSYRPYDACEQLLLEGGVGGFQNVSGEVPLFDPDFIEQVGLFVPVHGRLKIGKPRARREGEGW